MDGDITFVTVQSLNHMAAARSNLIGYFVEDRSNLDWLTCRYCKDIDQPVSLNHQSAEVVATIDQWVNKIYYSCVGCLLFILFVMPCYLVDSTWLYLLSKFLIHGLSNVQKNGG